MSVVGLHHVQIACPAGSEDALRGFYGDLLVEDVDAVAKAIAAAGGEVRWDEAIPGARRFHTDDPVGNRVELQQA